MYREALQRCLWTFPKGKEQLVTLQSHTVSHSRQYRILWGYPWLFAGETSFSSSSPAKRGIEVARKSLAVDELERESLLVLSIAFYSGSFPDSLLSTSKNLNILNLLKPTTSNDDSHDGHDGHVCTAAIHCSCVTQEPAVTAHFRLVIVYHYVYIIYNTIQYVRIVITALYS